MHEALAAAILRDVGELPYTNIRNIHRTVDPDQEIDLKLGGSCTFKAGQVSKRILKERPDAPIAHFRNGTHVVTQALGYLFDPSYRPREPFNYEEFCSQRNAVTVETCPASKRAHLRLRWISQGIIAVLESLTSSYATVPDEEHTLQMDRPVDIGGPDPYSKKNAMNPTSDLYMLVSEGYDAFRTLIAMPTDTGKIYIHKHDEATLQEEERPKEFTVAMERLASQIRVTRAELMRFFKDGYDMYHTLTAGSGTVS